MGLTEGKCIPKRKHELEFNVSELNPFDKSEKSLKYFPNPSKYLIMGINSKNEGIIAFFNPYTLKIQKMVKPIHLMINNFSSAVLLNKEKIFITGDK